MVFLSPSDHSWMSNSVGYSVGYSTHQRARIISLAQVDYCLHLFAFVCFVFLYFLFLRLREDQGHKGRLPHRVLNALQRRTNLCEL